MVRKLTTRLESQLLKRLDELDDEFNQKFDEYLDKVIYLPPVFAISQVASWQVPHHGELARLLTNHANDIFPVGQAHGDILVRDLHQKYGKHQLADWQPSFYKLAVLDNDSNHFWLTPDFALAALEKRSILLAGDVEGSISQAVKSAMLQHLQGASRQETENVIAKIMDANRNRARLITTTESTYAYNRGRLTSFASNEVDYVRFSAVMDSRTSPQCRSRHGKVMRMDSSDLADNIPPLHGRCRSILSPLYSRYEPEAITPETTNWHDVAPLPKNWRVGEKAIEQAKKRDHKIMITDTAINKVDEVKVNEMSKKQNKMLHEENKNVLKKAKNQNSSNEVLSICNNDFSKRIYIFGDEFGVDPNINPDAVMLINMSKRKELFYVHNHPSTNLFSTTDIHTFLREGSIGTMSVVTNQGEVYVLHKSSKYDYNKARDLYVDIINSYSENNFDGDEVVKRFLKGCRTGGIIYERKT